MARPAPSKKNGHLTVEERRLAELEEQNRRRVKELEDKLSELPRRIEEQKRKQVELKKLKAMAATTALPRTGRYPGTILDMGRRPTTRKRDRDAARLKFLLLCVVLASLLLLLWRSLP